MTDAKRCLYLVCYDVADPRRLRRVHRFLPGCREIALPAPLGGPLP